MRLRRHHAPLSPSPRPARRARTNTDTGDFFSGWTARNAEATPYTGPDAGAHQRRNRWLVGGAVAAALTASVVLPQVGAIADPSAHTWYRLRMCESSDNYRTNTGNGHYGAYQFDVATWRSVGGTGLPSNASPAEQNLRALILYRMRGWQPWQCAGILGLRPDRDAGTGNLSGLGSVGTSARIPAFPGGSHWYVQGDTSRNIKTFQDEMHRRGYFPAGTGQYGPLTLAMVKKLQAQNGLPATGDIGPNTWRLAWTGHYGTSGTARTSSATRIPAFPGGSHWYVQGDTSRNIKTFQDEMHRRGYFPAGTGQYGPLTLAMVKKLQAQNGLPATGDIGPNTWRLAWTGHYHS